MSRANQIRQGENNMARPVGVTQKTKDNSRKKFREHDEWMEAKKLGRRKQVWMAEEAMVDAVSGRILGVVAGRWKKATA
jgi:hypothetical protein